MTLIHKTSSFKRVNKELENFKAKKFFINLNKNLLDFYNNVDIDLYITNDNNNESILLEVAYKNKIIYELNVPKEYPFKPYSIRNYFFKDELLNLNYSQYLNNILKILKNNNINFNILYFFLLCKYGIKSKFLNETNDRCFCCTSLTCDNLWSPAFTVNNYINEYVELKFILNNSDINEYKKLENIYNCLFNKNDIYFNKLPNVIIEYILSYI
jgi:hypothetical protein